MLFTLILLFPIVTTPLFGQSASGNSDRGVMLYTPYVSRTVSPGQSLNYGIEVINTSRSIQNISLSVASIPNSWDPTFTAGNNTIQQIAVKPSTIDDENSTRDIDLHMNVPLRIQKGVYRFSVLAETDSGNRFELPLRVQVTEEGTFETGLQVDQANMEGYADSDFNYNITLNNQTAQEQNYALAANAPPGWDVRFRSGGNFVTSVNVPSNESQNLRVTVKPSSNTQADTVQIPIRARSGNTSATGALEAVIKGKYDLDLTTPSGRLSTEVTAGSQTTIQLSLHNTGTVPLRDISLESSAPTGWTVEFDESQITRLDPGESRTVSTTVAASNKAIAGDYQLDITAETPQAASETTFRITVNKSVVWGSIGIFVILLVIGGISYLFKMYGRR